jgi:prephenate dehydrogenase (NADP+)
MAQIGMIGMGDMGRLYVKLFVAKGYKCNVCDLPARYPDLCAEFRNEPKVTVFKDGFGVSRISDFIIYSVEAASIRKAVATFGPATKVGAIVGGQTSVKEPEILAFEEYLPSDVHIVTFHSLHGPKVSPKGQPLVVIRHRADDSAYSLAMSILQDLESEIVSLTYTEQYEFIL